MNSEQLLVSSDDRGARLDKWLALRFPDFSREQWKRRIAGKHVLVNGQTVNPSAILLQGDEVYVVFPEREIDRTPKAEPINLDIIFEDDWLAVIDKPAGLVVHPAHGHESGTLVNAVLARFADTLSDVGGSDRPGIVHRLDKDTSGVILIARDNRTHEKIAKAFREHQVDRLYDVIVWGLPRTERGLIDAPVARGDINRKKMEVRADGKIAKTEFEVLSSNGETSHLRCRLITGRTHQIRVHLAYIGYPVVGDTLYGGTRKKRKTTFHLLHASELAFTHPVTGQHILCRSPLPERFLPYISQEAL